jgi:hypothetical protein
MALSPYQVSVPVYRQFLHGLHHVLGKAKDHCAARKIDPAVLVGMRLYPDMLPLGMQVAIATNHAATSPARLMVRDIPVLPDALATLDDLQARVVAAQDILAKVQAADMDGCEDKPIELKLTSRTINFDGKTYLLHFAMPNFYFHVTTAYDILRHAGVELGKMDFMGPPKA